MHRVDSAIVIGKLLVCVSCLFMLVFIALQLR